jgi:hypothetical protein
LHVVAGARRTQVQRSLELATECARCGIGIRPCNIGVDAEVDFGARLQFEHRRGIGYTVDGRASLQPDRATLAVGVERRCMNGEQRTRFQR